MFTVEMLTDLHPLLICTENALMFYSHSQHAMQRGSNMLCIKAICYIDVEPHNKMLSHIQMFVYLNALSSEVYIFFKH